MKQRLIQKFGVAQKATTGLFMVATVVAASLLPAGSASALTTQPMAYIKDMIPYYSEGVGQPWHQMDLHSSDTLVDTIDVKASGCVMYRDYDSEIYTKPSVSSTDDTLFTLPLQPEASLAGWSYNDTCGVAYYTLDDATLSSNSIWYKATPTSTPVYYGSVSETVILTQIAVDNNGGIAWLDQVQNLWYKATPTATAVQIAPDNAAAFMRMNGNGNVVWQDNYGLVSYRENANEPVVQYSETDIAAPGTISIASNGAVAWSCNTSSIYYRASPSSDTQKLTVDYTTSTSYIASDNSGILFQNIYSGLEFHSLADQSVTPVAPDFTSPSSFDIY